MPHFGAGNGLPDTAAARAEGASGGAPDGGPPEGAPVGAPEAVDSYPKIRHRHTNQPARPAMSSQKELSRFSRLRNTKTKNHRSIDNPKKSTRIGDERK